MTALILCHNVTPVYNDAGEREFQASSPDEVALVKFVDELGLRLVERDENKIVIEAPGGRRETYQVLANFPFSSDTKRMGIVVKHQETGLIIFYLKGAEVVIEKKTRPNQRGTITEACDNLSIEGLRTLVITQKVLSQEEYDRWAKDYNNARSSLHDRQRLTQEVIEQLEDEMELLGVTGVEDKLQVNVQPTIESLRLGGIKVWMLTGDKVETAKCIAISAGLKSRVQRFHDLINLNSKSDAQTALKNIKDTSSTIIVIDGNSLDTCLSHTSLEKEFFELASGCPAVCVCRCSPTQKAIIVKKMKEYTQMRSASVGDGGNDVAMI